MKILKKINLRIKLHFTKYQFREARSIWYTARIYEPGSITEQATYNVLCDYESKVKNLKRELKLLEI